VVGEPNSAQHSQSTEPAEERTTDPDRGNRLWVFWVLAVLWLGFLAFGQVRARFWIRNEFQIEWRSVTGIWGVAVGELPGGAAIQALVLIAAVTIVFGVLGCLYLLLVTSEVVEDPVPEQP